MKVFSVILLAASIFAVNNGWAKGTPSSAHALSHMMDVGNPITDCQKTLGLINDDNRAVALLKEGLAIALRSEANRGIIAMRLGISEESDNFERQALARIDEIVNKTERNSEERKAFYLSLANFPSVQNVVSEALERGFSQSVPFCPGK